MTAYEFYWDDDTGGAHLIGILPERRKDMGRITQESIMNWGRMVMSDYINAKTLYFIQVEV